jgi:hypothetical protein
MTASLRARALCLFTVSAVAVVAMAACSPGSMPTATPAIPEVAADVELWPRILQQEPYPYTTPLPPEKKTAVDGTYSKMDPREGTRPFCLRCMPYPAEGGLWLLQLDRGAYRILSARSLSGWRSLGSYAVSGDQIVLFNDPHCMKDVGVYRWELEGGQLELQVIEDECALGWRGITFTNYPWVLEMATTE